MEFSMSITTKQKKERAGDIRKVLKKYRVSGTISVLHESVLVVKVKAGSIDFGSSEPHSYSLARDVIKDYKAKAFIKELICAMKNCSQYINDVQSEDKIDLHNVGWGVCVEIGTSNRAYQYAA
ncbi:MAG: hypothetical protein ACJAS1_003686 [Oleiphilaceae bacterium]|jgi:hypothetical protein